MSICRKPLFSAALRRVVRVARRSVALFAVPLVVAATSNAQETGSVHGHVKNLSTGKYLTNAQVVIEETGRTTYTNEYGEYRFNNVPLGEVTVKANYVGLGEKSITVSVGSGITSAADIALYSQRAGLEDEEVFELEAFTVEGSDFDSNAIAQQERKTSSNLKLVQHADALGDIAEGNIGEFLKNMPGIAIDYVASDARSIKLRGMGAEFTTVTVDGAPMASANSSGANRSFELEQVSLSNVEQLEVYKLPRPDNSANSIGGSVNLVSRNAFAQGGRKIRYKAYLTWNSTTDFTLNESPGWLPDTEKNKVNPSFELSYSDVFLEGKLGASFSFSQSNKFNVQQRFSPNGTYRVASDGTVASDRLQIQDGPKFTFRQSVAGNFDYKLSENTILTLRTQRNWYEAEFSNRNRNWRIKNATATGDSTVTGLFDTGSTINGSHRNKAGETDHIDLGAKHNFGDWKIDYGYTYSKATNRYRDFSKGYSEAVEIKGFGDGSTDMLTLRYPNASDSSISVTAVDGDGGTIDDMGFDLDNGYVNYVRNRPNDSTDTRRNLRLNVTRDFEIGDNNASIKFGYDRASWARDRYNRSLQYKIDTSAPIRNIPASDFLDTVYHNISPGFGVGGLEWPSQSQVYQYYQTHQDEFDYQLAADLKTQAGARMDLEEIVTSYYLMGSFAFAGDRGMFTTGVRYEDTEDTGRVAQYAGDTTDAEGDLIYSRDADGFLQGPMITEGFSYGTYHPSAHLRYNITNKLVGRLSYANTLGRPNFADMYGPANVNDPINDEDGDGNFTIDKKNPELLPRRSNNVDLTFEYYAGETSMISASLFQNKIKNFIGTTTRTITPEDAQKYGLSETSGFEDGVDTIKTKVNAGDAKVQGLELSWNQSLDHEFIPEFFRQSSFYANSTFLKLNGNFDNTDFSAEVWEDDLPGFSKRTISYGFLFKKRPVSLNFRWNIRGKELSTSTTQLYDADGVKSGTKLYRGIEERTTLDITGEYKINDRMSVYFAARNATNAPFRLVYWPDGDAGANIDTILYREEIFGADWSFGVKGTF